MIYLEPAGRFDFAKLIFRRHSKIECFLESGNFSWGGIDKVDPRRPREGLADIWGDG
jgi:hypothetical protein